MLKNSAFVAAVLAFLTFILSKIHQWYMQRDEYKEKRQASIVRFQVDMRIRDEDLQSSKVSFNDAAYQSRMINLIKSHADEHKPFRFCGVSVTDTKVQEEIASICRPYQANRSD